MKVTLKDIAEIANVSIATVSKVLSGKDSDISEATRKKVLKVAEESNYRVNLLAKAMVTKDTHTLGLIIPDIKNCFFTEIANSVEKYVQDKEYSLFLCNSYESFDLEINHIISLESKQVDGIIIAGTNKRDHEREKKLFVSCPIVSVDRKIFYRNVVSEIFSDNYTGTYDAVNQMIEKGHKNIIYIAGPFQTNTTKYRVEAFKDCLFDHNLAYTEESVRYGEYTSDYGYKEIINNPPSKETTAIFCGNDLIAVGVIKALNDINIKVPDDISVIGCDNSDLSKLFQPTLSTINQETEKMGELSAKAMINMIENKPYESKYLLPQELITRDSSMPVK